MNDKTDIGKLYQPDHPANRADGIEALVADGNVLRLRARSPLAARLVLKSEDPLTVVAAHGARAELRQGWDGTVGYAHYSLDLSIPAAGDVAVSLRAIPPSAAPVASTDAELAEFRKCFAARPSRFPEQAADFADWQAAYRRTLAGLLMGGGLPKRVPTDASVLAATEYPKFTLRRVEYRSHADRTNVLLLSLPRGVPGAPLLVALHGHEAEWGAAVDAAYTDPAHADGFCAFFAERGWAVLQPATMKHELQHPAWTLQGEWTWDAMTALDYAAALPEVDPHRVGVCGLSTGAHLAMNLLALDQRIRAGVVGCIFSTWHHYRRFRIPPHCDCGIMGQIAQHIEQCDWAALAAPKPVQFQHGREDNSFCPGADPLKLDLKWNTGVMPTAEYETAFSEVQRAYRLAGVADRTATHIHDGPHSVNGEAAFAWQQKWVK